MRFVLLALALALGGCAIQRGAYHAHPGPGGGDRVGHVTPAPRLVIIDVDSDYDGILDSQDLCPDQPGNADNDGCAVVARAAEVAETPIEIDDVVYFNYGSDLIRESQYAVLDEIAELLLAHPEVQLVSVEGHTDDMGSASFNLALSLRRARAVIDYLEAKGVPEGVLVAVGLGMEDPFVDNMSPETRALNRRVNIIVRD